MTQIQIFNHEQFGKIRICQRDDKEMFCLNDVCKALALTTTAKVKQRLTEGGMTIIHTPATNQYGATTMVPMTYIDEANLYRCIFQSRKAEAEAFQNWVFDVVLPQIRKTGGYVPVNDGDDELALLSRALMIAQHTLQQKDKLLEQQKPLVGFAKAVSSCEDSILIGELAKLLAQNGIEVGRTRLFAWLRLKGYLFQRDTSPIQKWVEQGIFDTDVTIIRSERGPLERITTRVTGKGQRYFMDGFLSGRFNIND